MNKAELKKLIGQASDIMESFDESPAMTVGFDTGRHYTLTADQMTTIAKALYLVYYQYPFVFSYEEWYNLNEESILIELAETGADREMDFDLELEFTNRYEKYLEEDS